MEQGKNKRVDEVLSSLEGMQRAEAGDFLFGKIEYKLTLPYLGARTIPLRTVSLAAASVLLLLALNLFTVTKRQQVKTDPLQELVNEYGLTDKGYGL
jgi:hypothetical protein